MDEPRRITISDPSRPARAPQDELDAEQPRSRRGLYLVVGALAVLAALRAGDTALDQRAAADEDRRLGAVVELELTERFSGQGISGRDDQDVATVSRTLGIRNTGPRDVELLSVSFGPLVSDSPTTVGAGREQGVRLTATTPCRTRPQDTPLPATVAVTVRTSTGQVVEQQLPLDDAVFLADPSELRRACGYLEVFEATFASVQGVSRRGDSLVIGFQVGNFGRLPVDLVRVTGGAGMRVQLLAATSDGTAGPPVALPVLLPGQVDQVDQLRDVVVVLDVGDCSAVQPGAELFDGEGPAALSTTFADATGEETTTFSALEGGEADALVADVCG